MNRIIVYLIGVVLLLLTLCLPAQAQLIPSDTTAIRFDWNSSENVIAVSDAGRIVSIIDGQTHTVLNVLPTMPFPVRALRWSDDGTRLAIGGEYSIQIWDNAWDDQQAALSLTLQVPADALGLDMLYAIDWNDAAQQILTTALRYVYIWDSQTGQLIRTIEPFTTPMVSAAWSSDGTMLAHADSTGYVSIESLMTGEVGGAETYDRDAIWAMDWEPNGAFLVVGTNSGTLQIFQPDQGHLGTEVVSLREDHIDIFSVNWHPTLPLVGVGYADGLVEIWNPYTYDLIQRVQEQTGSPVMSISWSPDGRQLAYTDGTSLIINPAPIPEIPTPIFTPTLMLTPTLTPTPTPSATPTPAAFQRLRVTAICSDDPATSRRWRIRNPNPYPVPFTWEMLNSPGGQQGTGNVPAATGGAPSTVILTTPTERWIEVIEVTANHRSDYAVNFGLPCGRLLGP